jgi:arylsulfatase A-like enzyme
MPSVVALPHQCDRTWRGVRTGTRKLVLNTDGRPWLLFDLEQDPLEMKNLSDDPARAGEMAELSAQAEA